MNDYLLKFKRLQKREQNMVLGSAAFIFIMLLYLLIWEPVFTALESEITKNQNQKTILSWMQNAEKQVASIRSDNNYMPTANSAQSLSSLVNKTAVSTGIRSAISKTKSAKNQSLKVKFNSVEFDRLTQWLGKLQSSYGIRAKLITINHTDTSGLVSCQVTLEKSST